MKKTFLNSILLVGAFVQAIQAMESSDTQQGPKQWSIFDKMQQMAERRQVQSNSQSMDNRGTPSKAKPLIIPTDYQLKEQAKEMHAKEIKKKKDEITEIQHRLDEINTYLQREEQKLLQMEITPHEKESSAYLANSDTHQEPKLEWNQTKQLNVILNLRNQQQQLIKEMKKIEMLTVGQTNEEKGQYIIGYLLSRLAQRDFDKEVLFNPLSSPQNIEYLEKHMDDQEPSLGADKKPIPTRLAKLAHVVEAGLFKHFCTAKGQIIYNALASATISNPDNKFEVNHEYNQNVNILMISESKIREKVNLIIELLQEKQLQDIQMPIWKALMISHEIGEYAGKKDDFTTAIGENSLQMSLNNWIQLNNLKPFEIDIIVTKLRQWAAVADKPSINTIFAGGAPAWKKIRDGKIQVRHSVFLFPELSSLVSGDDRLTEPQFINLILSAKQFADWMPNQSRIAALHPGIETADFLTVFKEYLNRLRFYG